MRVGRLDQIKTTIYVAIACGGAIEAGVAKGFVKPETGFWVGVAIVGLVTLQAKLSKGADSE